MDLQVSILHNHSKYFQNYKERLWNWHEISGNCTIQTRITTLREVTQYTQDQLN